MFIDANRQYSNQNIINSKKRRNKERLKRSCEKPEEDITSRERMTP